MLFTPQQTEFLDPAAFGQLRVERHHHVLRLTLNRPEKKNALSPQLLHELAFALSYAQANPEIWLVILAAAGDVFCAGMDLKAIVEGANQPENNRLPAPNGTIRLGELMEILHKPSIAQIQGPVYAGGFLLMLGCTWALASNAANFSLPEVKRGLFPFQVMEKLLELGLSNRRVLDWCLRGKTISAIEASEVGLVSEIHDPQRLNEAVQKLTDELLSLSPTALKWGLEAYHHLPSVPDEDRQTYLFQQFQRIQQTADAKEGVAAFAEKRPPLWTGQ